MRSKKNSNFEEASSSPAAQKDAPIKGSEADDDGANEDQGENSSSDSSDDDDVEDQTPLSWEQLRLQIRAKLGANDYLEFSDDWSEVVPQLLTLLWARRQAESGEIGREALETNDAVTFVKRVEELLKLKSTDVQAVAATDDGGTTVVEGGLTIRIRTGKKIIKESTNVANYKREELAFSGGEDQAKTFAGLLRMLDALDQICFHHQYSKASALLLMRENLGGQAKELISSAVTLENAIQTLLARYAREAIVTRARSSLLLTS